MFDTPVVFLTVTTICTASPFLQDRLSPIRIQTGMVFLTPSTYA